MYIEFVYFFIKKNYHLRITLFMGFFKDTLKPPVRSLTPLDFDEIVAGKPANQIFLVDFFSPSCAPCMQLAPEWRRLAKVCIIMLL